MNVLVLSDIPLFAFNITTSLGVAGIRSDVMSTRPWSVCRLSRYCRRYIRIDRQAMLDNDAALADRIIEHCRRRGLSMIVPTELETARFVIHHRERLGPLAAFPLPDAAVIERLHNKWTFAQLLHAIDVPHPPTRLLSSPADAETIDLPPPWVIKPPAMASEVGVATLRNRTDLACYLAGYEPREAFPRIVQQFVPGIDGDLTMLADHGRVVAWTVQHRLGEKGVQFVRNDRAVELGSRIVAATGYHGVIDFDFRWDERDDALWIIECNPRFPGTLPYKLWAGVNLAHMAVQIVTGEYVHFAPAVGHCENINLAPRAMLRGLRRGQLRPADVTPYSESCWRMAMGDPLPHLWNWCTSVRSRLHDRHLAAGLAPALSSSRAPSAARGQAPPLNVH